MSQMKNFVATTIESLPTTNIPFEGYTRASHPLNDIHQVNAFGSSVRYINESLKEIGILEADGCMTYLPPSRKDNDRVIVVKSLMVGSNIDLCLKNMKRILGEDSRDLINYIGNVLERDCHMPVRTIDLYYVIPVQSLKYSPDGITHKKLRVTLFDKRFEDTILPFDQQTPIQLDDTGKPEEYFGGSVTIFNAVDPVDGGKPLYVMLGNEVLEIAPTPWANIEPGLHIQCSGTTKLLRGSSHVKQKYMKQYGYHENFDSLVEAMANKEKRIDHVIKLMENLQTPDIPEDHRFDPNKAKVFGMELGELASILEKGAHLANRFINVGKGQPGTSKNG